MKIRYTLGWVVLLMGLLSFKTEQEASREGLEVLQAMGEKYLEMERYSFQVEYKLYYNEVSLEAVESGNGVFIRNRESYYQEELGNILIQNKEHQIKINPSAEVISISRAAGFSQLSELQFNPDSLITMIEHTEKKEDGYQFFFHKGNIGSLEIMLNDQGLLHSMRNHYRYPVKNEAGEEVYLISEVKYGQLDRDPELNKSLFLTETYFQIEGEKILPKGIYKHYKVLNNI